LPNLIANALYENRNGDYVLLDSRIKADLHSGDVVYSDASTYFSARSITSPVFVSTYGQTKIVKGIPEHDTITVLIIHRNEFVKLNKLIPGNWVEVNPDTNKGGKKGDSNSMADISIYRRKAESIGII
jgi:hypothetical protein